MHFSELPEDDVFLIFQFLTDIIDKLRMVCQKWKLIVDSSSSLQKQFAKRILTNSKRCRILEEGLSVFSHIDLSDGHTANMKSLILMIKSGDVDLAHKCFLKGNYFNGIENCRCIKKSHPLLKMLLFESSNEIFKKSSELVKAFFGYDCFVDVVYRRYLRQWGIETILEYLLLLKNDRVFDITERVFQYVDFHYHIFLLERLLIRLHYIDSKRWIELVRSSELTDRVAYQLFSQHQSESGIDKNEFNHDSFTASIQNFFYYCASFLVEMAIEFHDFEMLTIAYQHNNQYHMVRYYTFQCFLHCFEQGIEYFAKLLETPIDKFEYCFIHHRSKKLPLNIELFIKHRDVFNSSMFNVVLLSNGDAKTFLENYTKTDTCLIDFISPPEQLNIEFYMYELLLTVYPRAFQNLIFYDKFLDVFNDMNHKFYHKRGRIIQILQSNIPFSGQNSTIDFFDMHEMELARFMYSRTEIQSVLTSWCSLPTYLILQPSTFKLTDAHRIYDFYKDELHVLKSIYKANRSLFDDPYHTVWGKIRDPKVIPWLLKHHPPHLSAHRLMEFLICLIKTDTLSQYLSKFFEEKLKHMASGEQLPIYYPSYILPFIKYFTQYIHMKNEIQLLQNAGICVN